jgi:transcriptional regulator with XRE-family HTH domain
MPETTPPISLEMRIAFGQELRKHRTEADMTLAALAKLTGAGLTYISELERGQHNLGMDLMVTLAAAVGKQVRIEWDDAPKRTTRQK